MFLKLIWICFSSKAGARADVDGADCLCGNKPCGSLSWWCPSIVQVCGTCNKPLHSTVEGDTFTNGSTNHRGVGKLHVIV